MGDLRWVWKYFTGTVRAVVWIIGTVWLGAAALVLLVTVIGRLRRSLSETLRCPRGHETPAYQVFECACGALHEGWAFSECRVCGLSAGWMPCATCGLPIRNPMR